MTDIDPMRVHNYSKLLEKQRQDPSSLTDEERQEIITLSQLLGDDAEETIKTVEANRTLGIIIAVVGVLLLGTPILGVPLIVGGAYLISGFHNPSERESTEEE